MPPLRVLIAGATGSVGRQAVAALKARNHRVTALSRRANELAGIADRVIPFDATSGIPELAGHDVVLSALGAPVASRHRDRSAFHNIDYKANLNLLTACKRAGIGRFVYVAAHVEPGYADTAYIRAHEEFVQALRAAAPVISSTVVRPTGIFSAFDDLIAMARRGALPVIGGGMARTNPIHQADVAEVCANRIAEGPAEISIGGPDTLTRRDIADLVFAAIDRKPRLIPVSPGMFAFAAKAAGLFQPRLGELLDFVARVSVTDSIAPAIGRRRLEDYLRNLVLEPEGREPDGHI